jgi:hypothetical protein
MDPRSVWRHGQYGWWGASCHRHERENQLTEVDWLRAMACADSSTQDLPNCWNAMKGAVEDLPNRWNAMKGAVEDLPICWNAMKGAFEDLPNCWNAMTGAVEAWP